MKRVGRRSSALECGETNKTDRPNKYGRRGAPVEARQIRWREATISALHAMRL